MLRIPLITMTLALLGGAAMGQLQPTMLDAQEAPCSWGSDVLCMKDVVCTERAAEFQLWPLRFSTSRCLQYTERYLYYRDATAGGSRSGQEEGDDTPPGDDGSDQN